MLYNIYYIYTDLSAGTENLISSNPTLIQDADISDESDSLPSEPCKKNLGEPKRLRRWSRGHQFIVRAGGHIDSWQPLYK